MKRGLEFRHCTAYFMLYFCCAGGQDSPLAHFGGGVISSLISSMVSVPIDIIRQRQMVQTSSEGSYKVGSSFSLFGLLENLWMDRG